MLTMNPNFQDQKKAASWIAGRLATWQVVESRPVTDRCRKWMASQSIRIASGKLTLRYGKSPFSNREINYKWQLSVKKLKLPCLYMFIVYISTYMHIYPHFCWLNPGLRVPLGIQFNAIHWWPLGISTRRPVSRKNGSAGTAFSCRV